MLDFLHVNPVLTFVLGVNDGTSARGQSHFFVDTLEAAGTSVNEIGDVADTGHDVSLSDDGAPVIRDLLVADCVN